MAQSTAADAGRKTMLVTPRRSVTEHPTKGGEPAGPSLNSTPSSQSSAVAEAYYGASSARQRRKLTKAWRQLAGYAPLVRAVATDGIRGMANALYDESLGRLGTNEDFVYRALEFVHATGQVEELNRHLGDRIRLQGNAPTSVAEGDGFIRHLIDKEMSGSEKQRALDFLETGRDQFSSSGWAYRWEGFTKSWKHLVDLAKEQPMLVGLTTAATIGLGLAFPPVAVLFGLSVLGWGVFKSVSNEVGAAHADSQAEKAHKWVEAGEGLGITSMAAPSLVGLGTLSHAGAAAGEAGSFADAVLAFLTHEGILQSVTAADSAEAALAVANNASKGASNLFNHIVVSTTESPETNTALRVLLDWLGSKAESGS